MKFDVMAWDARQNANRHRAEVARRAERIAVADSIAEAKRVGICEAVRAVVDDYFGFDFCETVANS